MTVSSLPDFDDRALEQLPITHFLGNMLFDPIWSERFHEAGPTELLHVRRGTVHLETRQERVTAGPGDLLFIPGGTEHRDVFDPEQGLAVFMVQFHWPGIPTLFDRFFHHCLLVLSARQQREVAAMLAALERDVAGGTAADHLLARSRLLSLLLYLLREANQPGEGHPTAGKRAGSQRSREIMLAARNYLDRHYRDPISLEAIADALHVSPFHLSHIFSQENDFSLFAYLTNLRMTRAHDLLRQRKMKVAEVAEAVGYENSGYFSKVFKKHFGYAPSECP